MTTLDQFISHHNCDPQLAHAFEKRYGLAKLFCKCGSPNRIIKSVQSSLGCYVYRCCGQTKCEMNYGKTRPAHSALMKKLAADGTNEKYMATLMKKGELFNKEVNSISFKRKKLSNAGYDVDNLSDDEVVKLNAKRWSDHQLTPGFIGKRVIKLINNHGLHDIFSNVTYEDILKMSPTELADIRYKWYSWHHVFYCSENCVAKYFKRTVKTNLKFHIRKLTEVKTRSSYESSFIDFFEENQIKWDYESFRIILPKGSYKPDFIFEYENQKYILEVKGFLLAKNKVEYLTTKINAAYDYAKNNGYAGMILTYDPTPTSMPDLINQKMTQKF